jgi:hypothetical protein
MSTYLKHVTSLRIYFREVEGVLKWNALRKRKKRKVLAEARCVPKFLALLCNSRMCSDGERILIGSRLISPHSHFPTVLNNFLFSTFHFPSLMD